MRIVGVTGTNGKTTCVHLICSLLKDHLNCASFGTLGIKHYIDNQCLETKTTLTTLGRNELQQNLNKIINLGTEFIAMEVSSHGIVQDRIAGVEFTDLIFTNLSHDHLDYHKTMEDYFQAKLKLFTKYTSKLKRAIINLDNSYGVRLINLLQDGFKAGVVPNFEIIGFSVRSLKEQLNKIDLNLNSIKTITCEKILFTKHGINVCIYSPWGEGQLQINLLGLHNLSNVLASIGVCAVNLSWLEILNKCQRLDTAIGRLQKVTINNMNQIGIRSNIFSKIDNFGDVFIDYAHTPDGLENALLAIKQHYHDQNICCVFGCGGDRDPSKRPEMLKVAEKYCNIIILTQDNSRTEDPQKIIQDILSYQITNNHLTLLVELDRKRAINLAINKYAGNNVILIAGKGHETTQIIGTEEHFFCDYTIAKDALSNLCINV